MNTCRIFLLLSIGCRLVLFACAETDTERLLKETVKTLPERARDQMIIVERRDASLREIDSFAELQARFRVDWHEDLQNIEVVAPTDAEKAIYFKAAHVLPPKEYAKFLLVAAEQAIQGKINQQQLKWALFPSVEHLRGFWSEELPDQVQLDIIARCREVFANDPKLLEFFDGLESGEVLTEAKKFKERYYGPSEDFRPPRRGTRDGQAEKSGEKAKPVHLNKSFWVAVGLAMVALFFFLFRNLKRIGT